MKVWALPANENWICDQLVDDWNMYNPDMATRNRAEADVIWLISDWAWRQIPFSLLQTKKVVTTIHHIVREKFDKAAQLDFNERDSITNLYHVYNQRTYDFVSSLTTKPIKLVPYWANQNIWSPNGNKLDLRTKYKLPQNVFLVGSFQRDTEGSDLISPKLEKGPDILADALVKLKSKNNNLHVLLAGWRRQYIIKRLADAKIEFTYFERPEQKNLLELYQTLDLYAVTARTEGGPQALLECGLMNVPVVSTPVGIAEQVLPDSAINVDVTLATPAIPNVDHMKLPHSMNLYRVMFENV